MFFRRVINWWLLRSLGTGRSEDPGRTGERIAARFFKRQGYRILARNLRMRQGEIDLILEPPPPDSRVVVVVEVKTRQAGSHRTHLPEWRVNHRKRQRLIRLAAALRRREPFARRPVRFDILAVDLTDGGPPHIRHHAGAFASHW